MHRGRADGSCGRGGCSAARLASVVIGDKLSEGDVSRTASGTGTRRRQNPEVSRTRATMTTLGFKPLWMLRSEVGLHGLAMAVAVTVWRSRISILPARLKQDAAGLGAIGWWRSQRSGHGCQAPFFYVGFDEDKASLSKVDVYGCGAVGAYGGEKVWILDAVYDVVQFLAIASKEYAT